MAARGFTGQAADVPGVWTITLANTWAADDDLSLSVGRKTHTMVSGGSTLSEIAAAFANSLLGEVRNAGLETSSGYSNNFGAMAFGEFCEFESVTASGAVVTLVGKPGVDIYAVGSSAPTVAATTAGDGTATLATVQSPTGSRFFDDADNWGGTVPTSTDTVHLRNTTASLQYALETGVAIDGFIQYMSHTGRVGLPPINTSIQGKPYVEYRQRHISFDDATGTNVEYVFGVGEGAGSPLTNVLLDQQGTGTFTVIVHATGNNTTPGEYALNIETLNQPNTAAWTIEGGSVSIGTGEFGSDIVDVDTLVTGGGAQPLNMRLGKEAHFGSSATWTHVSGNVLVELDGTSSSTDITCNGGVIDFTQGDGLTGSGGYGQEIDDLTIYGGEVISRIPLSVSGNLALNGGSLACRSTLAVGGNLTVDSNRQGQLGTLDLGVGQGALSVTGTATVRGGGRVIDPTQRGASVDYRCPTGVST